MNAAAADRATQGIARRATFVLHLHGLERAPDAAAGTPDAYPPYDLLRVASPEGDGLRLVLAVAGFAPERLEITVAGDQLSIAGEGSGDGDRGRYTHRGVAARRFRRAFRLARGLDVVGADLDRGLLSITIAVQPGDRAGRTVAIRSRSV